MKRLMAILIVLLVAATAQADITAWLMGTPADLDNENAEYLLRVGLAEGETEFGIQSNYVGLEGAGQWYGAYGLVFVGDGAYIGYSASIIDAEDGGAYGPVAGLIYEEILVIEYQYRDYTGPLSRQMPDSNDAHKVYAGLRLCF
jgi:hypothetical protein